MKLLIIESPGKQKTIQKYLGADWKVVASLGHIRGLEQNLDFLTNDFEPKYEFLQEKAKAIKELKESAKGLKGDEIYLAADKDMEGEQIAYSVCLLLHLPPKTTKRVTFTEITEKAIRHAIEHPGIIDMNKVNTQKTRAMLDIMIGFTMSPLLWRYVAPSLSAGRCQTPALRLVVEREKLIESFQVSSSWHLYGTWHHSSLDFQASMEDELEDEESAMNYLENIHTTLHGLIVDKKIKPWTEKAPEPLITSTLQQQASAMFHMNPKNTMKIAQKLYEAGHITYMRTDKAVLSEDAIQEAKKWVQHHYGEEFVSSVEVSKSKRKSTEEVKAQEAHEAIRPTHLECVEIEGDWTDYDKKIYRMIWQRTIQSVMSSASGEYCTIKIKLEDDDFQWSSRWKRTIFEGWKRAGQVVSLEEQESIEDTKEKEWTHVMKLSIGDQISWSTIHTEPKETKAQPRFTEATLVRELEKHGIGRPSTFASLLSVIQDKGYVEMKDIPAKEIMMKEYTIQPNQWPARMKQVKKKAGGEKNKLVPTNLGCSVLQFMLEHFEDLFNYGFTAQMEKRLDKIAEGEEEWKSVVKDMWHSYQDRYVDLSSKQSMSKKNGESNAKVREFSNGLKAVQSKKGPLLLQEGKTKEDTIFFGWPSIVSFQDLTEQQARQFVEEQQKKKQGEEIGEWEGNPIIKKTGKFGEYLQCGDLCIPYQVGEEMEKTCERLEHKKKGESGILKQGKEYVIRSGPYGPYMMKTSLKKMVCVSIPKGLDISGLTEKDMEGLYKSGLEAKKKWKSSGYSGKKGMEK